MSTPARVLLIGNDPVHLGTRAAALEHFWQIGISTHDPLEILRNGTDLVVVFESLPELERQTLVERIKQEDASILVVKINGFNSGPHAGADAIVDAHEGPGALVSAIYELLTERGLGSRQWPIAGDSARLPETEAIRIN